MKEWAITHPNMTFLLISFGIWGAVMVLTTLTTWVGVLVGKGDKSHE